MRDPNPNQPMAALDRVLAATREYAQSGTQSVKCDVCGDVIAIERHVSHQSGRFQLSLNCKCGKYKGGVEISNSDTPCPGMFED